MHECRSCTPLDLPLSPLEVAARWPREQPLVILHSGSSPGQWARWSLLASPRAWFQYTDRPRLFGEAPRLTFRSNASAGVLQDLDTLLAATRVSNPVGSTSDPMGGTSGPISSPNGLRERLPLHGGWVGFLSYDLGRVLEPTAQRAGGATADRRWPLIELAWCPEALVFDHSRRQWFAVGSETAARSLDTGGERPGGFRVGPLRSCAGQGACIDSVARTLQYIAAGDVFQANIAQRLTASFSGSTRRLMLRAMRTSDVPYGAYLEASDGRCVLSMSPELFLHVDAASREVVTRPIKGTRPAASDVMELQRSEKDAAELHMIVDLMRNDLGRVCRYGSVEVICDRIIETHRTVHHGAAEIAGRLRDGVTAGDLLGATFPPGSVTGAPKVRAMQIIDELEPVRRGPYCGAIGLFGDDGSMDLNVAIRTILLTGERTGARFDRMKGTLDYSVGAGIVADSDPVAEHHEMLDKAAVLELVLAGATRRRKKATAAAY